MRGGGDALAGCVVRSVGGGRAPHLVDAGVIAARVGEGVARGFEHLGDARGGVGAVVLERPEQYAAAGLDPGAEIGREPAGPIGSGPVPEPSTFVLLASGLAAVWWLRRKRAA